MIRQDADAALEFLELWRPGGPWVLTAIAVDKKSIDTGVLTNPKDVEGWLHQYRKRNIYFTVNPVSGDVGRKPSRENVDTMDWLHVDVDPRAGEDLVAEQERIRELFDEEPKPSCVIFSGGGYQAFWRLVSPFKIDGQEARFNDAAAYNKALEVRYGGDNCHSVDHIMRLPGTVNHPDSAKRKRGRKTAKAELVRWSPELVYSIDDFERAAPAKRETVDVVVPNSEEIPRLKDVSELPDAVSDPAKVVIVQGDDPDEPTRFPSRSEALWFVCCELVRADVPDDLIYGIITDPQYDISRSVLDKKNWQRYAAKQIHDARAQAKEPALHEMNERYALIAMNGRVRIASDEEDPVLNRRFVTLWRLDDFKAYLMNRKVKVAEDSRGNAKYGPLSRWWLEHPNRRQFQGITFLPGRDDPKLYNLWRGFAHDPQRGDLHELYLDHLLENVCGGDDVSFEYLVSWMARAVQHPDQPGQTAIVLRGNQGVGKGVTARVFGSLFGGHYLQVNNAARLTGNFNAHLRDCSVLFVDEAFYAGDRRHAGILKALVTEDHLVIEPKGVDAAVWPNCLHLIMASNEEWVVPAGFQERRFCVLDVTERKMQDAEYFGELMGAMKRGGFSHLLHYLLQRDLSDFEVRKIPNTEALTAQKVQSMDPMHQWWMDKLREGRLLDYDAGWPEAVLKLELRDDFVEYCKRFQIRRPSSSVALGHFMHRCVPEEWLGKLSFQSRERADYNGRGIERPHYYALPRVDELRKHWDRQFGGPYDWPEMRVMEPSFSYDAYED